MRNPIIILFLLLPFFATAQLSQPGVLRGISEIQINDIPFETMPPVDHEALIEEDRLFDTIPDIPWRFGENIEVDINTRDYGVWSESAKGFRAWHLGISSPGAYSLNLTFDQYKLPPGAELYVYNTDGTEVLGAFTEKNNQDDLYFATTLLAGDALIIEYIEPVNALFSGVLNLELVTHAYRDPFSHVKGFGHSGWCNLNVACDEADDWQDQVNSVVMLVTGSNGFCSGVLVNNSAFDATPYVLSANHCFRNPSTVVFWFNWQSEECNNPPSSPSHDALSGAVTRARHSSSDFWLLQINNSIPETYNPYFAGWNRTLESSLGEFITGIHHPRGDIKKFSYTNGGVQAASYLGGPGSGTTHWRITWDDGTTTEPGSSGSAIFDSEGRILGQLHGGYAACGNILPDWYGRFGISWTGGGSNTTRLSNWLDPENTNAEVIDGFNPQENLFAVELEANPEEGGTTTGRGEYQAGEIVEINATSHPGFQFVNWTNGDEIFADDALHTFSMPANHLELTANFEASDTFFLSFEVSDENANELPDAIITLNGVEKDPGVYSFEVEPGIYNYTVSNHCHAMFEGEAAVAETDLLVDVVLQNVPGDANGDEEINILDIISISNYFLGIDVDIFCFKNADLNGDNIINVIDIVGTIQLFENK
jgi:hypothetical protein